MRRAADKIADMIEQALGRFKQNGIPAGALVDQLPSKTIPPASGDSRGGVLLSDATPAAVAAAGAAGSSADASRSDHAHAHGNQAGGTLHSAATTSTAGFATLAANGGTTAGTVVQANDSRLSDSRAPTGSAGGDLAGTYPNPTVANDAVTYAKMQNVSAASKLLGRGDSGSGDPQEIALGTGLSMSGTTLSASSASTLTVEEVDGSPTDSAVTKIKFPNGTLSIASHEATYTPTGGGGGGATISTSAFGSPPGSPSAGDLWLPSDSFYILRYTGSAWVPWGPLYPFTDPTTPSWSWVNQGSAAVDTTKGGISLSIAAASGFSLRIRKKSAPSTPYTATFAFLHLLDPASDPICGVCWRESSSGKLVTFYIQLFSAGNPNLYNIAKWNSETSFSASYTSKTSANGLIDAAPLWIKLEDDGTNRKVHLSKDGQNFQQLHSVGRTDFMTADEVGFFCVERERIEQRADDTPQL